LGNAKPLIVERATLGEIAEEHGLVTRRRREPERLRL
jgi:hypothetical protein